MKKKADWSRPYYGLTHLGDYSTTKYWVTVDQNSILKKWFPGCGFNPEKVQYSSIEEAKVAGEKYMKQMSDNASPWQKN